MAGVVKYNHKNFYVGDIRIKDVHAILGVDDFILRYNNLLFLICTEMIAINIK